MNEIVSVSAPKKHQKKFGRTPKARPNDYWVRWLPQAEGSVTAWYEVFALEKPDRTHRMLHSAIGKRGAFYTLGRIGSSRLEYPSDKAMKTLPDPASYLRERIVVESDRAKNFIDYVLAQNDVTIDERWRWIWPNSCYFVMTDEPPFPKEGFRGGRYKGIMAPRFGLLG
ncbi:MAG: hypothetical protein KC582_01915 [Candidatus Magasanikbacteria bacterium]|nr:hypothetical protein [Candidatus Magasanikbacteria bacterium]MCA9390987.1 hypothetical protein [Candidatus Magasanikbacteria bacterium]